MIQSVALCHRWIRRSQPRLRAAFLREAVEALARDRAPELSPALAAGSSASDAEIKTIARGVERLIKNRRASAFLISWGFLAAREDV